MTHKHPVLPEKTFVPHAAAEEEKIHDCMVKSTKIYKGHASVNDIAEEEFNTQASIILGELVAYTELWNLPLNLISNVEAFADNFEKRAYRQSKEYYAQIKYWLEELYFLLVSKNISETNKKNILTEFLEALTHCADSVFTRIQQTIMSFKGQQAEEVHEWLAMLRTEIIINLSRDYCTHFMIDEPYEIHYQKHFTKLAAESGWHPVINENVVDTLEQAVEPDDDWWFKQEFIRLYNPTAVIRQIAEQLSWRLRDKIQSLIPDQDGHKSIIEVTDISKICKVLESLPAVSHIPNLIHVLLSTAETTEPPAGASGFRITGTDYYYLLRPVNNLIFHLVPHFYSWLVREDSRWFRKPGAELLTEADELGFRYFILPYAPEFCFVIDEENTWSPLDLIKLLQENPSAVPDYISPVTVEEATEWELTLAPATLPTVLRYLEAGKTDFVGCCIADTDLRGLPVSLARKVLDIGANFTRTVDIYQARWLFVPEEDVGRISRVNTIIEDRLQDRQLLITDPMASPDSADDADKLFAAVFRYQMSHSEKLRKFFKAACIGSGYHKNHLHLRPKDRLTDMDFSCLGYALKFGQYPDGLTIAFHHYDVTPAQFQLLLSALTPGRFLKSLYLDFRRSTLSDQSFSDLIRAIESGSLPPNSVRLQFNETLEDSEHTHSLKQKLYALQPTPITHADAPQVTDEEIENKLELSSSPESNHGQSMQINIQPIDNDEIFSNNNWSLFFSPPPLHQAAPESPPTPELR